jgi:hypothetical protein
VQTLPQRGQIVDFTAVQRMPLIDDGSKPPVVPMG